MSKRYLMRTKHGGKNEKTGWPSCFRDWENIIKIFHSSKELFLF